MKIKKFLSKVLQSELKPIYERRLEWTNRIPEVKEILRAGCIKAEKTAAETLSSVRKAMQIDYFN